MLHQLNIRWNTSGASTFSSIMIHGSNFCLPIVRVWEKAMASHSSTLAWKIPSAEEPGGLQSMGCKELDTTERLHFHFSLSCIGEGNGSPFQCSCLENLRDDGAWWAAICGVAQSRTRLKRLSNSSRSEGVIVYFLIWFSKEYL